VRAAACARARASACLGAKTGEWEEHNGGPLIGCCGASRAPCLLSLSTSILRASCELRHQSSLDQLNSRVCPISLACRTAAHCYARKAIWAGRNDRHLDHDACGSGLR
jgi:hypothetical protein